MMRRDCFLIQILVLALVCGCATVSEPEGESAVGLGAQEVIEPAVVFADAGTPVTLPLPGDVHLAPSSRYGARYDVNLDYLRYRHNHNGEEMLHAFDERHYAPNKFLEMVWDREYAGKWLDAATRAAVHSDDPAQLQRVDDFAAALRKRQQPDGYMGIPLPTDRELDEWEQNWDLWNQWNSLMGFLTHYEFRGDKASLETASRIGTWVVKAHGPIVDENAGFFKAGEQGFTNATIIGQLVRLYRHNGDEALIEFVRQVNEHYPPITRMRANGEPEMAHGYMLSAVLGGVTAFADATSDHKTLAWVEQVWDRMANNHLFPTGSLTAGESLREGDLKDTADAPFQETCATTEWIFFTQSLYEVTGRARYIEMLEKTFSNALLGAQSEDGMKWCYFLPLRYHKDWFHGPTNCCYWSGPKGIVRIPQVMYATQGNGLCVNFFETSSATLAPGGTEVRVTQESAYPAVGHSTITLESSEDWEGPVRIRVPSWTTKFDVLLDGRPAVTTTDSPGYRDISLPKVSKHVLEIRFDIPFVCEPFDKGQYMRRGPELLSMDVRDNSETTLSWVSFPAEVVLEPADSDGSRRRYCADLAYVSSGELRSFMFTPYADAGNEGAAFQTVFRSADKARRNSFVSDP